MPKETINPPELFPSLHYGFSQIVTSIGGKTIYLSGQVAWDQNGQIIGTNDLAAQTQQTLQNVDTARKLRVEHSTMLFLCASTLSKINSIIAALSARCLKNFFQPNKPLPPRGSG